MTVNKHKDIIINKYTEYNEDERLVSARGHNLEYLTTMHYIQKFLKPSAKIFERVLEKNPKLKKDEKLVALSKIDTIFSKPTNMVKNKITR